MRHAPAILIVWFAMMASRMLVVTIVSPVIERAGMRSRKFIPVVTWSGIRGALSMVLVLSLPRSFEYRGLFVDVVFGCVLMSIVGQGVSFGAVLKALDLVKPPKSRHIEMLRARLAAVIAALHFLHDNYGSGENVPVAVEELQKTYIEERGNIEEEVAENETAHKHLVAEEKRALSRRLDYIERDAIRQTFTMGLISEHTFRRAIGNIDARLFEEEEEKEED